MCPEEDDQGKHFCPQDLHIKKKKKNDSIDSNVCECVSTPVSSEDKRKGVWTPCAVKV